VVTIFCLFVFVLSAFNLNLFSDIDNISLSGSHPSDSPYFVKFLNTLCNFKAVGRPNFTTVDITAGLIFHIRSNLRIMADNRESKGRKLDHTVAFPVTSLLVNRHFIWMFLLFSAHSLGCFHEHSRLDRDKYVTIE